MLPDWATPFSLPYGDTQLQFRRTAFAAGAAGRRIANEDYQRVLLRIVSAATTLVDTAPGGAVGPTTAGGNFFRLSWRDDGPMCCQAWFDLTGVNALVVYEVAYVPRAAWTDDGQEPFPDFGGGNLAAAVGAEPTTPRPDYQFTPNQQGIDWFRW